jgi:hypothetical protein
MRLRAAGVNVGQIVDDHETANNAWAGGAEGHGNATSLFRPQCHALGRWPSSTVVSAPCKVVSAPCKVRFE